MENSSALIKDIIFQLLTSNIDWRDYGCEKNTYYEDFLTLDQYIEHISEKLDNFPKENDCMCNFYLVDYLPCCGNLHGDYIHKYTEMFAKYFKMGWKCDGEGC